LVLPALLHPSGAPAYYYYAYYSAYYANDGHGHTGPGGQCDGGSGVGVALHGVAKSLGAEKLIRALCRKFFRLCNRKFTEAVDKSVGSAGTDVPSPDNYWGYLALPFFRAAVDFRCITLSDNPLHIVDLLLSYYYL